MSSPLRIACIAKAVDPRGPSGVSSFLGCFMQLGKRQGFEVELVERPIREARKDDADGEWNTKGRKTSLGGVRLALGYFREILRDAAFFLRNRKRLAGRILFVNEFGCETLPIAARLAFPLSRIVLMSHTHPGLDAAARHPVRRLVEQRCMRSASDVVFNSGASRKNWEQRLSPGRAFGTVRWLGTGDPDKSVPEDYPVREPNGVDFVCLARFVEWKGHRRLLEAWRIAVAKSPGRVRLLLVGDGPALGEMRELSGRLGISGSVVFMGARDAGAGYINGADVLVLLSIEPEAFGLVLLEAMSRKKPVVASRIGGIAEVVRDGETGVLVDPCNTEEVAGAIVRLAESAEERRRLGDNGYERWKEHFTEERMLDRFEKYFKGQT